MHTPEYAFEHVPSNVAAGVRRLGLTFPVALDNSYDTWNAYDNQSWPAAYLIDASGQIRHISIGEGDYTSEEQLIRQLLTAAHPGIALPPATDVPDTTPDDPEQTPETYLGAERHSATPAAPPTRPASSGSPPAALPADSFALAGTWTIGQQSITAGKGAGITLAYHASASTSTSEAAEPSPSPPAARARSSASPAPPTSTPSPPSSPPGRHRDHQALTGAAGLLVHLRLISRFGSPDQLHRLARNTPRFKLVVTVRLLGLAGAP